MEKMEIAMMTLEIKLLIKLVMVKEMYIKTSIHRGEKQVKGQIKVQETRIDPRMTLEI